MMTLRTAAKDDFFETRFEEKPKMDVGTLMSAVNDLTAEISCCDKEIQKWQESKQSFKDKFHKILRLLPCR